MGGPDFPVSSCQTGLLDALWPALDALARDWLPVERSGGEVHGWRVTLVTGGANNRLYRLRGPAGDLAAKFTLRDDRDRAGREHAALRTLADACLDVAPRPLLLAEDRYPLPLVVQTWLEGDVRPEPPSDEEGWRCLVQQFAAIHTVVSERTTAPLQRAVLTMVDAADGQAQVAVQAARVPAAEWPHGLADLLRRVAGCQFPRWPAPALALCRCDPNPSNFIRRPGAWASVDWENAGWGDPAFELADLFAHPRYEALSAERRASLIERYCALPPHDRDAGMADRVSVYLALMLAWWTARLARYLYEAPRGLDERLVARPAGWLAEARGKYDRWLARAHAALDDSS